MRRSPSTATGLRRDHTTPALPTDLGTPAAALAVAVASEIGAFVGARLSRVNRRQAPALGVGVDAHGVIEMIAAMPGPRLGGLSTWTNTLAVVVALVTSPRAPPNVRYAMARAEETAAPLLAMDTLTAAPDGALDHGPDAVRTF